VVGRDFFLAQHLEILLRRNQKTMYYLPKLQGYCWFLEVFPSGEFWETPSAYLFLFSGVYIFKYITYDPLPLAFA
jgi:hypothetical protein